MTAQESFSAKRLAEVFPPAKSNAFFDALFGGAEEGAYDIHLVAADPQTDLAEKTCAEKNCTEESCEDELHFYFELRQRPGRCLVCSLTYGLPQVFERHPVIDIKGVVGKLAELAGWAQEDVWWRFGATEGLSESLHRIPLVLLRHKGA